MGDEPYAALLPWAVFAVVDRAQSDGALWAGLGALITAIALLLTSSRGLLTSSRGETGPRNVMVLGAIGWFGALVVAGALHRSGSGFLAHDGRALSASGFALIAFGSLAFSPAIEHYTRPHVRSSRWNDPAFHRVNVLITLIWAATFTGVALANFVAASIGTRGAFTLFNWVVPIALTAVAAHRSRICWDDFNDDELFDPDPMRDLALDWETPPSDDLDR
ncbi:MAG: hypothetical protein QOC79_3059 [Actinomycetota bacterium]|jgi:hypothetical protein|nr:hypothetical protein [Actinomycetota bacterium]